MLRPEGKLGLIVPVSIISLNECKTIQEMLKTYFPTIWLSHYGIRPAKLFDGAEQRLTIIVAGSTGQGNNVHTTAYQRWLQEERTNLFSVLQYQSLEDDLMLPGTWGKSMRRSLRLYAERSSKTIILWLRYMQSQEASFIIIGRLITGYDQWTSSHTSKTRLGRDPHTTIVI